MSGGGVAWRHGRRWRLPPMRGGTSRPATVRWGSLGPRRRLGAGSRPRKVFTNGAAIQQALVKVARVRHADSRAPARLPSLQLCR